MSTCSPGCSTSLFCNTIKAAFKSTLIGYGLFVSLSVSATTAKLSAEQQTVVNELTSKYQLTSTEVTQALNSAHVNQKILDLISRPSEGKPWHQYRPIFLGDKRIAAGKKFLVKYKDAFAKAEKEYGVPAEMIAAIIGVETFYGGNKGHFAVLDALYTLGFHYPKRETFFRKEFIEYIKLCKEQGWPIRKIKGSYAGAMGFGQFMPSSYRYYGVDFSGDGKIDMHNDPIDAIGSVANYLAKHGWKAGKPIAQPATLASSASKAHTLANTTLKAPYNWKQLQQAGVTARSTVATDGNVNLLPLEQVNATDYWITHDNFYVITTYNRSTKYAMAVFQLSQALTQK